MVVWHLHGESRVRFLQQSELQSEQPGCHSRRVRPARKYPRPDHARSAAATVLAEHENRNRKISTLNEKPLHAALKQWYAGPDSMFEVSIDRFIIDILQDDLLE